ncbi:2-succinyl-5-enolpyruvyl-6-hydroxy-3-cyclohexene-1-carboxylic-acid synthase [Myxococcota bacterium]|nr:2-succinyl-5-enolpyruvyl-6-hydroxy-3-cyclohexene-1-carboxylic-acid synthase [Myxococcota bacterium]
MTVSTAALNRRHAGRLLGALAALGVRDAVLSPGSRNTPLVLAMEALARGGAALTLTDVLDERAAAFFALGLARRSGRPVILSCTSGSAGAHYLPALTEASASGVPLIVLTADRPAELHGVGAPQTLDQTRLFGPFVRMFLDLSEPAEDRDGPGIEHAAARAWDAASGANPGPVHLNLPFREPLWDPAVGAEEAPALVRAPPRVWRGRAKLDPADLDALLAQLAANPRGVIVVGPRELADQRGGPDRLPEAVAALAARLGWPVLAEPTSGLRFGPAAPFVVDHADAILRSERVGDALAPDLVLRLGQNLSSKATSRWLARHAGGKATLVHPAGAWHDPELIAERLIVADPAELLLALLDRALPAAEPAWAARWRAVNAAAAAALGPLVESGPLWEGQLARAVAGAAPEGALLHVASSMPIRDLDSFARARPTPLLATASRGVNGIDGTLCTALGLAARHEGAAWALLGDLATLHDAGAFVLAANLGRPVTAVVIDNGGGNIFGFLPIGQHPTAFEAHFFTPQALTPTTLARGLGRLVAEVTDLDGLRAALAAESTRQEGGLGVIVARVDRAYNLVQHRACWAAAEAAALAVLES